MVERLHAKGVAPERTAELRNWASIDGSASGEAYRREWGLEGRTVALYSGSIGRKQGAGLILDAARRLKNRADLAFVICGEGPDLAELKAAARDLPAVQFHPLQPAERLGELLALADLHLLPQIAAASDLVLPSKLTNMLASAPPGNRHRRARHGAARRDRRLRDRGAAGRCRRAGRGDRRACRRSGLPPPTGRRSGAPGADAMVGRHDPRPVRAAPERACGGLVQSRDRRSKCIWPRGCMNLTARMHGVRLPSRSQKSTSRVAQMKRTHCMVCQGTRLHEFIDLKDQPNGNNFLYADETAQEVVFGLAMMVCQDCWEVQIAEFPPQEVLFSDHPYLSGVNAPVVAHFKALAAHVVGKLGLAPSDLVIDVGCNDGTLLSAFREQGMRVLGVEPGWWPCGPRRCWRTGTRSR